MSENLFEYSSEALREALREVERREAAEAKALTESVTPEWRYTFLPSDKNYDRIFDDTVMKFTLEGRVINKAEVEAVGGKVDEGGMAYLVNLAGPSVIMQTGGGRLFISNPWNRKSERDFELEAIMELNDFLVDNPRGGDVTEIVIRHQEAKREA